MATINLGRIKPVFRGAYAGGTSYVIDDIVTSGDETFICILASTGNATSNATYWTKLAAKGTDGTDVGTTITTQGDILYRDGSGLARLAKGTARQGLQTNSGATAPEWVDTPQSLMTAQGDILYASSANTPAKLAKGTAAQALVMNAGATAPEWGSGGIAWQAVITADPNNAVAGRGYYCNTTAAAFTVTLPTAATLGDKISFIDYAATFDTNNLTIGRNSHNIQGAGSDLVVATERAGFSLVYVDATQGWLLTDK